MADDLNARAEISVAVLGTRELNQLITLIAKMQDGSAMSAKELDRLEKLLVKVGTSAGSAASARKPSSRRSGRIRRRICAKAA